MKTNKLMTTYKTAFSSTHGSFGRLFAFIYACGIFGLGANGSVDFIPSGGDFGINQDVDIQLIATDDMFGADKSGEACGCNQNPNDVNWSLSSKDVTPGGDIINVTTSGDTASGKLNTASTGAKTVTGVANFNWTCPASHPSGKATDATHSGTEEANYGVSEYYVSGPATAALGQDTEYTFNGPTPESWSSDGTPDNGSATASFTTKWTTIGEKTVTAVYSGKEYTKLVAVTQNALTVQLDPSSKQVLWYEGPKTVTFKATSNDSSGSVVYSWSCPGGSLSSTSGDTTTVSFTDTSSNTGYTCTVTATRGDGSGGNKAEQSVVIHVVKAWAYAGQSKDGIKVQEGGDPLPVEVQVIGIAADQLQYLCEIKPASASFHNEAGDLGTVEQVGGDPTKYTVKARWHTPTQGGCCYLEDSDGAVTSSIEAHSKIKLTTKYSNAVLGTEDQTNVDVVLPIANDGMTPDMPPGYLALVTEPEYRSSISGYRCELQWNNVWTAKQGFVYLDPAMQKTQYAAKISVEENYHKSQWEGTAPRENGGCSDLYTKKGTMYNVGMAGDGPFYYYGDTAAQAKNAANADNASAAETEILTVS